MKGKRTPKCWEKIGMYIQYAGEDVCQVTDEKGEQCEMVRQGRIISIRTWFASGGLGGSSRQINAELAVTKNIPGIPNGRVLRDIMEEGVPYNALLQRRS